ncbi:MAG: hypothetical protein ACRDM8_02035 [Gaiellaceae bacterium]
MRSQAVLLAMAGAVCIAFSGILVRLASVPPSTAATLQPALSVVLAVVLLDEATSAVQLAGIAVILAGVLLATAMRRPPVAEAPG